MTVRLQDLSVALKLEDKLSPAMGNVLSSLKGVGIGVGLVTSALGVAAAGFEKLVDVTFDWARKLDSIQDVMGGTAKQAATFNFVLEKSGTTTEQFTAGLTIMEKGLVNADGSLGNTGKKLEEFGINVLNANGTVRDQADLMSDISNKYNSFATQQERVNFLTSVFGRSGAELNDFFDTLANEGGIDKATQKVEALGLVIDPGKYEQFQRSLNEIKLGFQGVAITLVNKLAPAFADFASWWTGTGLPLLIKIIDWVDKNSLSWEGIKNTWQDHVAPVVSQLFALFGNLNGILERLSPSTDLVAGKFTALGVVQRVSVAVATAVNTVFKAIEVSLKLINSALETAINLWDAFKRGMEVIKSVVIPTPPSLPSTSSSTSSTSNPGGFPTFSPNGGGRASGGAILGGTSYKVNELGKPEVFTPNASGRIDPLKPQTVIATIDETLLSRLLANELAKVVG